MTKLRIMICLFHQNGKKFILEMSLKSSIMSKLSIPQGVLQAGKNTRLDDITPWPLIIYPTSDAENLQIMDEKRSIWGLSTKSAKDCRPVL